MTPAPDMISRAEADRQIQEAVAAALIKALTTISSQRSDPDNDNGLDLAEEAIRALITETAQTALTKPPQMLSRRRASMSNDLVKRLRKQSSAGRVNHVSKADRLAAADRIEELEAKLAKATDTLARIVRGDDDAHNWAIWTLAELTGKKT